MGPGLLVLFGIYNRNVVHFKLLSRGRSISDGFETDEIKTVSVGVVERLRGGTLGVEAKFALRMSQVDKPHQLRHQQDFRFSTL